MKPTPETDNCARVYQTAGIPDAYRVLLDLCRKIELERDKWKAAHDNQVNLKRMLMDRPDLKERARLIEQLCEERDELRKAADALAQSEDCPNCANNGWYMNGSMDDSHQVQCRWCETVSNSRFNALILYSQLPHVKKGNKSK